MLLPRLTGHSQQKSASSNPQTIMILGNHVAILSWPQQARKQKTWQSHLPMLHALQSSEGWMFLVHLPKVFPGPFHGPLDFFLEMFQPCRLIRTRRTRVRNGSCSCRLWLWRSWKPWVDESLRSSKHARSLFSHVTYVSKSRTPWSFVWLDAWRWLDWVANVFQGFYAKIEVPKRWTKKPWCLQVWAGQDNENTFSEQLCLAKLSSSFTLDSESEYPTSQTFHVQMC